MRPELARQTSAPPFAMHVERLESLDVFRGGTIAGMILVNNQSSSSAYAQLRHAEWHGWTFTDLVFPFFLWIVGVAITLSLAKRVARGDDPQSLLLHIARRSAVIFSVGLFLNALPYFNLATIRIPGVLQRIALCYLIAAGLFLFTKTTGRIAWTVSLLGGYWALMTLVPVPGCGAGSFEVGCNFAKFVDGLFLDGHMYSQTKGWDPEGIVSTLPAVATTLLGILAGEILASRKGHAEKTAWLFFAGNMLILAGLLLSTWMPINKKLWTTPYSLFTGGLACVVFASCYWLVDGLRWQRYSKPFAVYGMNALAIYVLSGLFAKLTSLIQFTGNGSEQISLRTLIWQNVFSSIASPGCASFLFGLAHVLMFFSVAWWMYRKNWIVRV